MGIRELVCAGKDFLILAGPSMDLDYRWKNGTSPGNTNLFEGKTFKASTCFRFHA